MQCAVEEQFNSKPVSSVWLLDDDLVAAKLLLSGIIILPVMSVGSDNNTV